MSAKGGRAPGLRDIPAAPASYRFRSREPGQSHTFHMYMPLRDLEHAATGAGLSAASVMVLMAMAHRTDVDGTTRAGVRELARQLHRSPGTIQRHVKRAIAAGFVEQRGCREDNRHRLWRVAGMDRRDDIARGSGENHHRGGARPRAGGARPSSTSRAAGARLPVELPGELIEPTRAFPQQEPPPASDWGRATPAGIRASREALRDRGSRGGAPAGPEPPAAALDAPTVPEAGFEAQNATENTAEGAA